MTSVWIVLLSTSLCLGYVCILAIRASWGCLRLWNDEKRRLGTDGANKRDLLSAKRGIVENWVRIGLASFFLLFFFLSVAFSVYKLVLLS